MREINLLKKEDEIKERAAFRAILFYSREHTPRTLRNGFCRAFGQLRLSRTSDNCNQGVTAIA